MLKQFRVIRNSEGPDKPLYNHRPSKHEAAFLTTTAPLGPYTTPWAAYKSGTLQLDQKPYANHYKRIQWGRRPSRIFAERAKQLSEIIGPRYVRADEEFLKNLPDYRAPMTEKEWEDKLELFNSYMNRNGVTASEASSSDSSPHLRPIDSSLISALNLESTRITPFRSSEKPSVRR